MNDSAKEKLHEIEARHAKLNLRAFYALEKTREEFQFLIELAKQSLKEAA